MVLLTSISSTHSSLEQVLKLLRDLFGQRFPTPMKMHRRRSLVTRLRDSPLANILRMHLRSTSNAIDSYIQIKHRRKKIALARSNKHAHFNDGVECSSIAKGVLGVRVEQIDHSMDGRHIRSTLCILSVCATDSAMRCVALCCVTRMVWSE